MFKEVKEFEYITVSEAKEIVEKIVQKRQEVAELSFETRKALRHLRNFAKLPADKARELVNELMKLPQVKKREIAVKLVDILPRVPDEIRIVYAKEEVNLKPEEIEEILEIISRYRE
ncbi:MAG: RNA polymerase Rpb4 [Archaeoglobaceae archaeon]|nr:RNA polymerase Rpb4 [Archaeoglobaceae archaeon]MDW8013585.1 RNA polymerase Rpb4 [Archaeoglobaceae archaeon]